MFTVLISVASTAAAYRLALAATKAAPADTMRGRLFTILAGGPGPFRPK